MRMFKFIKLRDKTNEYDHFDIEIRVDNSDIPWPDLMETFNSFLRACGYMIDSGHFVEDRKLDEYVADKAQSAIDALVSAMADAGHINQLLVHPDPIIRAAAQKHMKERIP